MARHRAALNHDASTSWSTDLSPDSLRLWDKNIPAPSPPCSPRFSSRHLSLGGGDGGGGGAFEKNAYRVHTRTDHARARFVRSLTRFPRSLIMARLCRVKIRYPWGGGGRIYRPSCETGSVRVYVRVRARNRWERRLKPFTRGADE